MAKGTKEVKEEIKDKNFSYKMTNKELDYYIRLMDKDVNDRIQSISGIDRDNMNPAFLLALDRAGLQYKENRKGEQTGNIRSNLYKKVDGGYKALKKVEKINKAKKLQEFIKNDTYSPLSYKDTRLQSKRAYRDFKAKAQKRKGLENVSFREWQDIVYMSEAIGDLFSEYGSAIQVLYRQYRGETNVIDFRNMVREVYDETPKGVELSVYQENLVKNLKKKIQEKIKNKDKNK